VTKATKATKELEWVPLIGQTGSCSHGWLHFVAILVVMQAVVVW